MTDFYRIAGMPRVIGAVDGSLIPIRAPHHEEHLYVCHKGFHVINAMAVCNAQLSFTNATLCADGMDLSTILLFSTPVCSMYPWKVVVGEMAGYWGIVGTASSRTVPL